MRIIALFIMCLSQWMQIEAQVFNQLNLENQKSFIPKEYFLEIEPIMDKMKSSIEKNYPYKVSALNLYKFCYYSSINVSNIVSSGHVYSNWKGFEDYLNDILHEVIPQEIIADNELKVYVLEDASFNARCYPNGTILFNVGCMSYMYNEAMIASLLAHEVGHFYLNHSLKHFVQDSYGAYDDVFGIGARTEKDFRIANEIESDSIGQYWYMKSAYNSNGIVQMYEVLSNLQLKTELKAENFFNPKSRTHPPSDERYQKLMDFVSGKNSNGYHYYLVDEVLFNEYKEESKGEILSILLDQTEYYECIDQAFKFHIFDPSNPIYIYYLMEGIRRNCYLFPNIWTKNFITHRHFNTQKYLNENKKILSEDHIFVKFPLEILGIAKNEAQKIKAKFYWKTGDEGPKFITYEQAFEFFYQVSKVLEEPECELSYALSLYFDKEQQVEYLDAYLSHPKILYREYANALADGMANKQLGNKHLLVYDKFYTTLKDGEKELDLIGKYAINGFSKDIYESIAQDSIGKHYLVMDEVKRTNYNLYKQLLSMRSFAYTILQHRAIKPKLHILNPNFWYYMKDLGVNDIWFVRLMYTESRKLPNDLEDYKALTSLRTEDIIETSNQVRFIDPFIVSVRDQEDKSLTVKVINFNSEKKLIMDKDGKSEAIRILKSALKTFEKDSNW